MKEGAIDCERAIVTHHQATEVAEPGVSAFDDPTPLVTSQGATILRRRFLPHRSNRKKPATQDGRALRRFQRRWIVERTNAWLGNFRRLVVRYDRSLTIYRAFFHIACFMIVLRRVVQ